MQIKALRMAKTRKQMISLICMSAFQTNDWVNQSTFTKKTLYIIRETKSFCFLNEEYYYICSTFITRKYLSQKNIPFKCFPIIKVIKFKFLENI